MVDRLIEELRERKPELKKDSTALELLAGRSIVRSASVSDSDISASITDGGGDGQVDFAVLLHGGKRVSRPSDVSQVDGVELEMVLIQSTMEAFGDNKLELLTKTIREIFDLSIDFDGRGDYNKEITQFVKLFRAVRARLSGHAPRLSVSVYFVALADSHGVHKRVGLAKSRCEELLAGLGLTGAHSVDLVGARDLIRLSNKGLESREHLRADQDWVMKAEEETELVALVQLGDFAKFLTSADGLKQELFNENVRDWERDVKVNTAIRESLDRGTVPFWWQNNGVTLLCEEAKYFQGSFEMMQPKIVNGLQTSHEVFRRFDEGKVPARMKRELLLVRVLQSTDEVVRDKIIRATNSQTAVQASSLRASNPVHEDIEIALRAHGLFYERRKNYYRNRNKKAVYRVTTTYLAQSILAQALRRPGDARARPGDVFAVDSEHDKVFTNGCSLDSYVRVALVQKRVDAVLRKKKTLEKGDYTNFRFHTSFVLSCRMLGTVPRRLHQFSSLDFTEPTARDVVTAFNHVRRIADKIAAESDSALDVVSKSPELNAAVLKSMDHE